MPADSLEAPPVETAGAGVVAVATVAVVLLAADGTADVVRAAEVAAEALAEALATEELTEAEIEAEIDDAMLDTIDEYTGAGMLEAGALVAGTTVVVTGTTPAGAVELHHDGIVVTVTVAATQVEASFRIELAHTPL